MMKRTSHSWWRFAIILLILAGGCGASQSALDPAGPQAGRISALWWLMLVICSVIYVLVVGTLIYTVIRWRNRRTTTDIEPAIVLLESTSERRISTVVSIATGATIVILFVLLLFDFSTGRELAGIERPNALTIEVTGQQWWWKVRYLDSVPSRIISTANEIHIPVGRPVQIQGKASDVIHSFWIPNLHGKRDLIPGHTTTTWIQADRPGTYFGLCGEFCGYQHAKMGLVVIAESESTFTAWADQQRKPAAQPADSVQLHGQKVFLGRQCVMCHSIVGTIAGSNAGPDLTHLASRRMIAANSLPNTRQHLSTWIVDPQSIKPGNHMPANALAPADLQALLTYLESLK
jgi:cytochrome c oxidase subunit II